MTARVIPMARTKGTLAELRAAQATVSQAKWCIVKLVAALRDVAPNHEVLKDLAPFIQPNEATDDG
jgi:hypothetical protein